METKPLWKLGLDTVFTYPSLSQELEVDVAIIGGGITGVSAAIQLIEAGKKVAILEADSIGGVTTSASTGNLYVAVQPYYQTIAAKFNQVTVNTIAKSRQYAINFIEKTINENNIDCAFSRRPWFIYTADADKVSFLEKEVETIKKTDISIEYTDSLPFPLKFKKAAWMQNQARFNPYRYVAGLAKKLQDRGCLIFENSRVLAIEEKNNCIFHTARGKIIAKQGIIATHTPTGIQCVQMCLAPYRSYAVGVHLKDNNYPEGHFWDLDSPHHVTCTHSAVSKKTDILIVSGNHHKTGQDPHASKRFDQLEKFLRDHFDVSEVAYNWSAQHYHSADAVPYIGLNHSSKNIYIATGYFADGLTYGTLAGLIISDTILQRKNLWAEPYRTTRLDPIAAGGFIFKENSNVFLQYLKDLPFAEQQEYKDLKPGEARVVEINREKCGVYKDLNQQLHIVSAVCTHMKCIVNWNDAEKTWDCPCHGSRFSIEGKVLEGPAQQDLEKK